MIKSANLGLRFLLEILMLVAVGLWGFSIERGITLRVVFGVVLPTAVAVVWGVFVAPKSQHQIQLPGRLLIELFLFGIATVALVRTNHLLWAVIFAITVIVNQMLLYIWRQ